MVGDLSRQQARQAEAVAAPPPTSARSVSSAEQRLAGGEAPQSVTPPVEAESAPRPVRIRVVVDDTPPPPPPEEAEGTDAAPRKPKRYRVKRAASAQPEVVDAEVEKPVLPEVERLTRALRKARESMEAAERKISDASAVRSRVEAAAGAPLPEITGVPEPDPAAIDRDLAERRARLAKPDDAHDEAKKD